MRGFPPFGWTDGGYLTVLRILFFVFFERKTTSEMHTWYLSPTSPTCRWRKNLSCGEISEFYKEFEQFMEFLSKFMPFFVLICVEKKWAQRCVCGEKMTNMRSAWVLIFDIWFVGKIIIWIVAGFVWVKNIVHHVYNFCAK